MAHKKKVLNFKLRLRMKKIINIFFFRRVKQRRKTEESLWEIEPQTLGFCAPLLYLWEAENFVVNKAIAKFMCDQRPES